MSLARNLWQHHARSYEKLLDRGVVELGVGQPRVGAEQLEEAVEDIPDNFAQAATGLAGLAPGPVLELELELVTELDELPLVQL